MIRIINEEKIVSDLVENNKSINQDTIIKIRCYIKYLKHEKNSKKEIRNKLDKLMLDNYEGFIMADWDKLLQSMVNKYSKCKNSEYKKVNDEILIYESELKTITEIGDLNWFKDVEIEKVLFIMLVLAKMNDSEWVNYTSEEIFKLARFKYKTKSDLRKIQREKLIYDLAKFKDNKILEVTNYGKHPSIKLLFTNQEGDVAIKLKLEDIENIIVEYLNWIKKDNYTYCEVCGKEIQAKSSTHKYCSRCKKTKELENTRERVKKHRKCNGSE